MKNPIFGAMMAAVAFAAISPAQAQSNVRFSQDGRPERMFRPASGLNSKDAQFVRDASISNLFEIKSSELAQRKGSNSFVREFAKEMITDHTAAQEELKQIASRKGAMVPQDLPTKQKMILARLSRLNGAAFDAAYQKAQKDGHAATSMKFKSEIRNGHDQDVKAYAVKTLPAVTMHYKMVIAKRTMMGAHKMNHGM